MVGEYLQLLGGDIADINEHLLLYPALNRQQRRFTGSHHLRDVIGIFGVFYKFTGLRSEGLDLGVSCPNDLEVLGVGVRPCRQCLMTLMCLLLCNLGVFEIGAGSSDWLVANFSLKARY